jgi:hypothetical protein
MAAGIGDRFAQYRVVGPEWTRPEPRLPPPREPRLRLTVMDMRGPRKRDQHVHIEEIRHSSSSAANVSSSVMGLALAGTTKHGDPLATATDRAT